MTAAQKSPVRKTAVMAVKILTALFFIGFIVYSVNFGEIKSALLNADYRLFAAACVFGILNIYFQFMRWNYIVKKTMGDYGLSNVLSSFFVGFSGGIITPMRLGEYVGRAAALKGADPVEVTLATFIDKSVPFIIVTITGLAVGGTYFSSAKNFHAGYGAASVSFAAVLLCGAAVFISRKTLAEKILAMRIFKKPFFRNYIQKAEYFSRLQPAAIFNIFWYSVLYYAAVLLQFGLLTAAFTGKTDIAAYASAGALMFFVKTAIVPFSLGDLGVREGASIFFLGFLGVSASAAFNASISLYFLNILLPALIGLPLFLSRSKNDRRKAR